jgi:membrane protein
VAVRAFAHYRAAQLQDHAAALTYYAMLALFPGLLLLLTLAGLFGGAGLVASVTDWVVRHGADPATATVVGNTLRRVVGASGGALSVAALVSLLLALNGASGAFAAAGRALNVVWGADDDRSFVRRKLEDLGMTLVVLVLLLVVLVAVFLGGGIVDDLFGSIGLGDAAATVWRILRWPLALVAGIGAYALVYAFAPAIRPPRLRWLSPGAIAAVVVFLVGSLLFSIYLRGFSSFGAAYGTFGAAIVLLLWLYLGANAFLLGAALNAELEREATAEPRSRPRPR